MGIPTVSLYWFKLTSNEDWKKGKPSWMIILNLIRENDFTATVMLFENKLIKTKNIEKKKQDNNRGIY